MSKIIQLSAQNHAISYKNIEKDNAGWVDPKKYLPIPYDVVEIEVEYIGLNRRVPAWWTGINWEGRRFRQGMKVLYWRKNWHMECC